MRPQFLDFDHGTSRQPPETRRPVRLASRLVVDAGRPGRTAWCGGSVYEPHALCRQSQKIERKKKKIRTSSRNLLLTILTPNYDQYNMIKRKFPEAINNHYLQHAECWRIQTLS